MLDVALEDPQLFYIGIDSWPSFAERVWPYLEKMAEGSDGRFLADDLAQAIAGGNSQLWVALSGPEILCAALTEVIAYPRLRALRFTAVVGHHHARWVHLIERIEHAAKHAFGCQIMEAMHQPGHERLIRHTGGWKIGWHWLSWKEL
jgi:hypothetical protein